MKWKQSLLTVVGTVLVASQSMAMSTSDIVYSVVGDAELANAILYYSEQYAVDPLLATATFEKESGFNQSAISSAGAIGIAQLMPGTAAHYGVNPYNRFENIRGGIAYLSDNLYRYSGSDWQATYALAAYNAGPGAVDDYGGVPPYTETINYINAISDRYEQFLYWLD